MSGPAIVWVDYRDNPEVAAMRLCGMTVMERVLRDAAKAGAHTAFVCGDPERLPAMPRLALEVTVMAPFDTRPTSAEPMAGNIIAGVAIVDEASRRRAAAALLETCRRPYDGPGDRYVIRAMSLRLTAIFVELGLTPNQVTTANVVVGLLACACAAVGTPGFWAAAGALIVLQVVLDSSDGELARLRHMHSRFGMWLDNLGDDVVDNLFVAGLGIGLGGVWLPIALTAAGARSMVALFIYREVARAGAPGDVLAFRWWFDGEDDATTRYAAAKPSLLSAVRAFGRRDVYILSWGVTCVAQLPWAALVLGVALSGVYFALMAIHASKAATPAS